MNLITNHICTCRQCKLGSTESNPTGKGKETTFKLLNPNKKVVDKFIVDDCLLLAYQRNEKCDFLFRVKESNNVFIVECKGSDILKAVSQLYSTLNILKDELNNFTIKGRIISTKVYSPNIRDINYSRLRAKLKGDLIVKNIIFEENI